MLLLPSFNNDAPNEATETEMLETEKNQVVRKSATNMNQEEREQFMLGWDLLIESGKLGSIASEHAQFERHVNHGVQVLADLSVKFEGLVGLNRFLPWHRSYITTLENEMREELKVHYCRNGIDPTKANKVFVPYWDVGRDRNLPQWVVDFKPNGEWTGVKVKHMQPELDNPCHEAYGLDIGEEYEVFMRRWPGTLVSTGPSREQFQRIMRTTTYQTFTTLVEWAPTVIRNLGTEEVTLLRESLATLPAGYPPIFQPLIEALESGDIGTSPDKLLSTLNQIRSILRAQQNFPDQPSISTLSQGEIPKLSQETAKALEEALTVYQYAPHSCFHFYAGGQDPNPEPGCPSNYGTVVLFQEVSVDPIFFMLHAELDRLWYSWEKINNDTNDTPTLFGDDALFRPWWGLDEKSGRTWTLDELVDHDRLPFTYDVLYPESAVGA